MMCSTYSFLPQAQDGRGGLRPIVQQHRLDRSERFAEFEDDALLVTSQARPYHLRLAVLRHQQVGPALVRQ